MKNLATALLLGLTLFTGCDDSANVVTDPKNLKPLTEEQKSELNKQEADIEKAERGVPVTGKKAAKAK